MDCENLKSFTELKVSNPLINAISLGGYSSIFYRSVDIEKEIIEKSLPLKKFAFNISLHDIIIVTE